MKKGPEHLSRIKRKNKKKVNMENTAKIPVFGASVSGYAG